MSLAGYFINITSASRLSIRLSLSPSPPPPAHSLCHPFISRLAILPLSLTLPPPLLLISPLLGSLLLYQSPWQKIDISAAAALPLFLSSHSAPLLLLSLQLIFSGEMWLSISSLGREPPPWRLLNFLVPQVLLSSNSTCCIFSFFLFISKRDDPQTHDFPSSSRGGKPIKPAERIPPISPAVGRPPGSIC